MAQSQSDLVYELHSSVYEVLTGSKSYGAWYGVSRKRRGVVKMGSRIYMSWYIPKVGRAPRRLF